MIELMTAAGPLERKPGNKIFRFIVVGPHTGPFFVPFYSEQNYTVCLLLPLVVRVVVFQFQPSATPSDGMNCTMIAVHALHPLFIKSYAEEKERPLHP